MFQRIEFSGSRGGVSSIVVSGPETVSQLLIQSAQMSDTGVYTCHLHYGHRPDANDKLRDNIMQDRDEATAEAVKKNGVEDITDLLHI